MAYRPAFLLLLCLSSALVVRVRGFVQAPAAVQSSSSRLSSRGSSSRRKGGEGVLRRPAWEGSTSTTSRLLVAPADQEEQQEEVEGEGNSSNTVSAGAAAATAAAGAGDEGDNPVYSAIIDQCLKVRDAGEDFSETVKSFLDMCDQGFLVYLDKEVKKVGHESERGQGLLAMSAEINIAMQQRLVAADQNLRVILQDSPDIMKMETKLRQLFRAGKVDVAFMVMLNMNLQQAEEAEATNAVAMLKHLNAKVMDFQDDTVAPEVRLMRRLIRTDCDGVRKTILENSLVLPFMEADPLKALNGNMWGKAEISPEALFKAIEDLADQARGVDDGVFDRIESLQKEVKAVVDGSVRPGPFRANLSPQQ